MYTFFVWNPQKCFWKSETGVDFKEFSWSSDFSQGNSTPKADNLSAYGVNVPCTFTHASLVELDIHNAVTNLPTLTNQLFQPSLEPFPIQNSPHFWCNFLKIANRTCSWMQKKCESCDYFLALHLPTKPLFQCVQKHGWYVNT